MKLHPFVHIITEPPFKSEQRGRVTVETAGPARSKIFTVSLLTEMLFWPMDLTRCKRAERPKQRLPFWKDVRKITQQGHRKPEKRTWRAWSILKNYSGIWELSPICCWVWAPIFCYFRDNMNILIHFSFGAYTDLDQVSVTKSPHLWW